ncbi:chaperone modulator CbpM [Ekhidna sp.]|uniref:chaperone modulator CbpM n=1 Tax=Ekhidna sp. TaxID=2608089 RepID=UPI003299839C
MKIEELISLTQLSIHYEMNYSFFTQLDELGLIEIYSDADDKYIHLDKIGDLERMIRLHVELNINLEGIDTIFNLLEKINSLETELIDVKNKLQLYEDDL